mgnify:CR=1 FL=1
MTNVALEQTVEATQLSCTQALASVQQALDAWSTTSTVNYTNVCTSQELDEVKSLVGDISAFRSASYSLAERFAASSTQRVQKLGDYVVQREQYDSVYVANKSAALYSSVTTAIDRVSVPNLHAANLSFANMHEMV